jgi:hypothetical protein
MEAESAGNDRQLDFLVLVSGWNGREEEVRAPDLFGIVRVRLDLEAGRRDSRGVDNLMVLCIVCREAS